MEVSGIPPCFYRVSIKALIIDTRGRILLCKESSGIWDLPGGGLDEGEDVSAGLKREIQEEMGLEIINHQSQPSYFLKFRGKSGKEKINVLYETQVKDLHFIPSAECTEIRFFDIQEMKGIEIFPNVAEFIKIFKKENHVHI